MSDPFFPDLEAVAFVGPDASTDTLGFRVVREIEDRVGVLRQILRWADRLDAVVAHVYPAAFDLPAPIVEGGDQERVAREQRAHCPCSSRLGRASRCLDPFAAT